MILIYPGDVNVGHLLDEFRNATDDGQDFSSKFGGSDFAIARGNHRNFLGLTQWCGNFGSNLLQIERKCLRLLKCLEVKLKYLWQTIEKHFNHRCFAVFFVGFSFLRHLFSFCFGLGVDSE